MRRSTRKLCDAKGVRNNQDLADQVKSGRVTKNKQKSKVITKSTKASLTTKVNKANIGKKQTNLSSKNGDLVHENGTKESQNATQLDSIEISVVPSNISKGWNNNATAAFAKAGAVDGGPVCISLPTLSAEMPVVGSTKSLIQAIKSKKVNNSCTKGAAQRGE